MLVYRKKILNRIIMEYANEGDLMQIIKSRRKQKNYFSNLFVKKLLVCLIEGVYCLHYRNIYHRDIKVSFYIIYIVSKCLFVSKW